MNWLLFFSFVFAATNFSDAALNWSPNYHLKAVLTIPSANITEPYEVWFDGEGGQSRVDFYNGMTKLYREYDFAKERYRYFKIQPETSELFLNKEKCHEVSNESGELRLYAVNTYLPMKNFKYVKDEVIDNLKTNKFIYQVPIKVEPNGEAHLIYSIWVTFENKVKESIPIPKRYVYELKDNGRVIDHFAHDYLHFEDARPEPSILIPPEDIRCESYEEYSSHEPTDPLEEFIEPIIEYNRVKKAFVGYKTIHAKDYQQYNEYYNRLNNFKANLRFINSVNRKQRSFKLAVNHLADLSEEEIKVFLGTKISKQYMESYSPRAEYDDDDDEDYAVIGANDFVDWRKVNAVSPVKDQTGLCGSCYSFTTAAALESEWYIANGCVGGSVKEISEQVFIDCTWGRSRYEANVGCEGGTYEYTLGWIKKYGAPFKDEYGPYLAMEGRCHMNEMSQTVMIEDYIELPKKKREIKLALQNYGPLLASIDANIKSFTFYAEGIYDDENCRSDPNWRSHGVTIVGYGKDNGKEYWILKNSFGSNWGEDGYIRMAVKNNVCGVKNFVYHADFGVNESRKCWK